TVAGAAFVLAVLIALVPGLTVQLLALLAGVLPILAGVRDLRGAFGAFGAAAGGGRGTRGLYGGAGVVPGVTVPGGPDVAAGVGGAVRVGGVGGGGGRRAAAPAVAGRAVGAPARPRRPALRGVPAGGALIAAIALAPTGLGLSAPPVPDDFYAAPVEVPDE